MTTTLTPPADAPDLLALREAAEARGMRLPLTMSEYPDDYPTIHNDGSPYGSAAQVDNVPFARYLVAAANAAPVLVAERDAAFDRGRAEGRRDVGKYANAIGRIDGALGRCGAKPMDETVAAVEAVVRERDTALARVAALEKERNALRELVAAWKQWNAGRNRGLSDERLTAAEEALEEMVTP